VCAAASGFVYCISVAGVTGERASVVASARPLVEAVRGCTDVPVAVGFGIAGPEQAAEVAEFADGVIVGSALINVIARAPEGQQIEAASGFVSQLRRRLESSAVC
jgi:tryptophan synthase alpha chain